MTAPENVTVAERPLIPWEQANPRGSESPLRILGFATQGSGTDDEDRLRSLAASFDMKFVAFHRAKKARSFLRVLRAVRSEHPNLVLMEGTGFAGGAAALLSRWLFDTSFVLSSGDAVGPFLSARWPLGRPFFGAYERLLYRNCVGFVGWTPYLVGRALTFGAPRAVTISGWAPYRYSRAELLQHRARLRSQLGIPNEAVVFGVAGSLAWASRKNYCYGYELVKALKQSRSSRARVLIVGDGDGARHIRELAGDRLGSSVMLTGRVARQEVPYYLAAMDIGSLPQSVDQIGSFRFTTKISEYLAAKLPFVTNQIPAAYDLDNGGIYRIPGKAPWDDLFVRSLASFMDQITPAWVENARASIPEFVPEFDEGRQLLRFRRFVSELADVRS